MKEKGGSEEICQLFTTKKQENSISIISYIIKILDNDQPGQLYYGKRLTHREDFSHLFEYAMRDMSPYAFEGNSTFSLENIKQEYPTFGCGDMRFPAYEIERENGSTTATFTFN